MKNIITLLVLLSSASLFAAGDGGNAGHITDLIYPAINFSLLFGFIFFKLRKPISDAFSKNSEEVESLFNMAEEKSKEAQIKLDMFTKKIESLDSDMSRILKNSDDDSDRFEKSQKEETINAIDRLKKDASNKIESEKNEMVRRLNSSLLDEVISKAKLEINSNNEYKSKATKKLLSDIG